MRSYELWHVKSRSALGDFETEAEALAVVREWFQAHGHRAVEDLLLGHLNNRGRSHPLAEGEALLERALAAAPDHRIPVAS